MHSLQEARTLGPLCGRSLILRHLNSDRPTPKLRIWGSGVQISSGRAIYVTGKPSLFRSSRTHRRLEDPISLRFSLRNSRKISCTGRAAERRMQSAICHAEDLGLSLLSRCGSGGFRESGAPY